MLDLSAITKFLHSRIVVKRSDVDSRMWDDLHKTGDRVKFTEAHVRGMAASAAADVVVKRGLSNAVKIGRDEDMNRTTIELELLILTRTEIAALVELIIGPAQYQAAAQYAPNRRDAPDEKAEIMRKLAQADALHRRGEEPNYKPNPDVKRPDFLKEGDSHGIQSLSDARGR